MLERTILGIPQALGHGQQISAALLFDNLRGLHRIALYLLIVAVHIDDIVVSLVQLVELRINVTLLIFLQLNQDLGRAAGVTFLIVFIFVVHF